MNNIYSILIFITAGLSEVGGGFLIWSWLRENNSYWNGIVGVLLLVLYGFLACVQPHTFGKVYVAYGGFFILVSFLWGWFIDGTKPDIYDIIGLGIIMIGIYLVMYYPR